MSRAEVHGLVLAAGASSRMGRPKALLTWRGETFVDTLADRLRRGGCASVTVVAGAHARAIATARAADYRVVEAVDWRRGMRASLRAGVRAAPAGPLVLTHVDRPTVAPRTIARLCALPDDAAWVPTCRGRPGHPVRIPRWLRDRLLHLDDTPLRAVIEPVGRRLSVDDPGILVNVNTPADLVGLEHDLRPNGARLI